jgi:hypothetical protein
MSNYDPNFTKGIKQWVTFDSQIDMLNQKLKAIRNQRDTLGEKLTMYMQNNDLTKTAFNFDKSRIIFKNEPKYSNLSYDFMFKCAQNYFDDDKKAQDFCQFVKSKRQKTYNTCLKRSSNNKTKK